MLSACSRARQSRWHTFRHNLVLDAVAPAARVPEVPEMSVRHIAFVKKSEKLKRQKPRQANNRKWKVSLDKSVLEGVIVSSLETDLVLVE